MVPELLMLPANAVKPPIRIAVSLGAVTLPLLTIEPAKVDTKRTEMAWFEAEITPPLLMLPKKVWAVSTRTPVIPADLVPLLVMPPPPLVPNWTTWLTLIPMVPAMVPWLVMAPPMLAWVTRMPAVVMLPVDVLVTLPVTVVPFEMTMQSIVLELVTDGIVAPVLSLMAQANAAGVPAP